MTLGVASLMGTQAVPIDLFVLTDSAAWCTCKHVFVLLFSTIAFKKWTDCVD